MMGYGTTVPHVVRILQDHVQPDSRVLEIGCGVKQYRPWLPTPHYTGLDLPDSPYVDEPPELACSAAAMPCADASFAVVFGVATFSVHDDVGASFREVHRVLRPGGLLLVFDYQRRVLEGLGRRNPIHKIVWDFPDLRRRLAAAGFRPDAVFDISRQLDLHGDPSLVRFVARRLRRAVAESFSTWLIVAARK
jgi:SAM-dependent methyltransferase